MRVDLGGGILIIGIVFILYIKFISESRQWPLVTAWPEVHSSYVGWMQVQKADFLFAPVGEGGPEAAAPVQFLLHPHQ